MTKGVTETVIPFVIDVFSKSYYLASALPRR
jgi:hypothetical protein